MHFDQPKQNVWREVTKVEFEALLGNDTWVFVDLSKIQYVFVGYFAFENKKNIHKNIIIHTAYFRIVVSVLFRFDSTTVCQSFDIICCFSRRW